MAPLIERYSFGHIVVDGVSRKSGVIVVPDGACFWWRKSGHRVVPEDLAGALEYHTPRNRVRHRDVRAAALGEEAREFLRGQEVEVVTASTGKACDLYNGRRAAGGPLLAFTRHAGVVIFDRQSYTWRGERHVKGLCSCNDQRKSARGVLPGGNQG
ncbi:MAG: Mth938-like domain-containing protein [Firmicutes bacterium]|nr:Mth938-like domain-containing protein [Bacillota bacterium]